MPRLPSVEEWLWRLGEIRNNLHVLLPSSEVRCSLAVSPDCAPPEAPTRDRYLRGEGLVHAGTQGLAGLRWPRNGELRLGGRNTGVALHMRLDCPEQPGMTARKFVDVGCVIADHWEGCPQRVLRAIPWAKYPTGIDGILLYACLYGMHPLLTGRELSIESDDDRCWPDVRGRIPNITLPCWVIDFDHDWRSLIVFTLDAIRHYIGSTTPLRFRRRRTQQPGRSAVEGEWSAPMSKTDMRVLMGNMAKGKFETIAARCGLHDLGGQLFRIRLNREVLTEDWCRKLLRGA